MKQRTLSKLQDVKTEPSAISSPEPMVLSLSVPWRRAKGLWALRTRLNLLLSSLWILHFELGDFRRWEVHTLPTVIRLKHLALSDLHRNTFFILEVFFEYILVGSTESGSRMVGRLLAGRLT